MGKRARARRIRMILTDVDGTLTDGTLALHPDGEEIKSYNVKDGLGVLLAQLADLKIGYITGKTSQPLVGRAARLRIDELRQGVIDKMPVFREILAKYGLRPEEVAYIGDDLGDLAVLEAVGLSGAPSDAVRAVRRRVHFVCRRRGGDGAFREFVDFILEAQGKWGVVTDRFSEIFQRKI